jgi:hypothetical protein
MSPKQTEQINKKKWLNVDAALQFQNKCNKFSLVSIHNSVSLRQLNGCFTVFSIAKQNNNKARTV